MGFAYLAILEEVVCSNATGHANTRVGYHKRAQYNLIKYNDTYYDHY